jgi:hypothetical protein|tara:strand:+ start:1030 stop:1503 length:474 start_codon:yes stop_codon:yes gene_type:complete
MKKTIILDDVLPTREDLLDLIDNKVDGINWYNLDEDHTYKKFCSSILDITKNYFDLSDAVGYEFWGHNGTRADWHQDKDETAIKTGKLSFPICSTVYYLEVSNLEGGELIIEDNLMIRPKTNRLVIFPPGQFHGVNPYQGKRVSLLVNPWNHQLSQK